MNQINSPTESQSSDSQEVNKVSGQKSTKSACPVVHSSKTTPLYSQHRDVFPRLELSDSVDTKRRLDKKLFKSFGPAASGYKEDMSSKQHLLQQDTYDIKSGCASASKATKLVDKVKSSSNPFLQSNSHVNLAMPSHTILKRKYSSSHSASDSDKASAPSRKKLTRSAGPALLDSKSLMGPKQQECSSETDSDSDSDSTYALSVPKINLVSKSLVQPCTHADVTKSIQAKLFVAAPNSCSSDSDSDSPKASKPLLQKEIHHSGSAISCSNAVFSHKQHTLCLDTSSATNLSASKVTNPAQQVKGASNLFNQMRQSEEASKPSAKKPSAGPLVCGSKSIAG
ncbi:unnamed protein product, partial [Protopolystoma xenopodis]